jgi:hypothetical protein
MTNENRPTTVQIDQLTSRKLALVAQAHERNKSAQVRFWVNREYAELERMKMLPVGDSSKSPHLSTEESSPAGA